MALTYGFYNSVNHDRQYDAIQFGQIFDGIITDGVYGTYLKGMMVIASENANEVIIQPGRAWFNHTWSFNDANLPFEAPQPEVLLDRVDTLVLDVNSEQAERQNKFLWVQGEPSSQIPQPPNLIRSVTHNQYPLCNVYRKAGTTMIYAADITNRVGTSDCPFVTGVLEGIDLDAWINQWDDEFHTWENSTKNNFETWMLSQQTVYTTWFNSIKDQMDTDMDEFEAWFEEIKDIIDESAALHLQAEIDALKAMLPAGSHITVSTVNSELFGRDVTLTDGVHEATARFDQVGFATFESYPYVGLLTITSSDGIQTASTTLNVPYFGRYSCEISFWSATVNIDGDPGLAGYQVMVRDSSDIVVGAVTLDSEGDGVWSATAPDTYKFSVTYGGGTMEVSLNVTQETTYSITLHGGFNYTEWLSAGGVSGTYASLDDVLSDEKAVRQLMTRHAAVDYLASFTADDTSVVTILNSDIAAKWITCTAYAEDVLTDAYTALMESIGKYGYGKWVEINNVWQPLGNVPIMTSNTAPYGEAIGSSAQSGISYYSVFDGNDSTQWASNSTPSGGAYVGYKFTSPVKVKSVKIYGFNRMRTFKIQASNDGFSNDVHDVTGTVNWTNASQTAGYSWQTVDIPEENQGYYLGYRFVGLTAYPDSGSNYIYAIYTLQFYGRQMSVSVPKMDSNTSPYGEAYSDSQDSASYAAWKAFDGNTSDAYFWESSNTAMPHYIGYTFTNPVCVKRVDIKPFNITSGTAGIKDFEVRASNDGFVTYDTLLSSTAQNAMVWQTFEIDNDNAYISYRLHVKNNYETYYPNFAGIDALQFFGFDYSEKEWDTEYPRHYIYDNGVELETITNKKNASALLERRGYEIYGSGSKISSDGGYITGIEISGIDFTNYTLLRFRIGMEGYNNTTANLLIRAAVYLTDNDWVASANAQIDGGLDTTSLNGVYKLFLGMAAGSNTTVITSLSEAWLE